MVLPITEDEYRLEGDERIENEILEHAVSVLGGRGAVGVVVVNRRTMRSVGAGVHADELDSLRCVSLADKAALYGTASDALLPIQRAVATARSSTTPTTPTGPATLHPHLLPNILAFLPSPSLATLPLVSPLFFTDRDVLVYKELCRRIFYLESPQGCDETAQCATWFACFKKLVACKPKGSLRFTLDTEFFGVGDENCTFVLSDNGLCGIQAAVLHRRMDDSVSNFSSVGELSMSTSTLNTPASTMSSDTFTSAFDVASPALATPAVASSLDRVFSTCIYSFGEVVLALVGSCGGSDVVGTAARLHLLAERVCAAPRKTAVVKKVKREAEPAKELHRIVVLGTGHVGKSAITVQYIQDTFVEDYDPNICDTYKKQDKINGDNCVVEIVDLAGQEEYASLRSQYYAKSDGFLAVYNIADPDSINELCTQYEEVLNERGVDSVPLVLVGNKCDLKESNTAWGGVTTERGEDLARSFFGGAPFLEISAKERINVTFAFHHLVHEIRREKGLADGDIQFGEEPEESYDDGGDVEDDEEEDDFTASPARCPPLPPRQYEVVPSSGVNLFDGTTPQRLTPAEQKKLDKRAKRKLKKSEKSEKNKEKKSKKSRKVKCAIM